MPNPLMRLGTPKRQTTEAPDRPAPVEPVIESVVGSNNPYRGMESHGVNPGHVDNGPAPEYDDTVNGYFTHDEEEGPDPIPVRIVYGDSRKEILRRIPSQYRFGPDQAGQRQRILGRDLDRRSWRIYSFSPGAAVVYIGGQDVNNVTGEFVPVNTAITGNSTDELWMYVDPAGAIAGSVLFVAQEKAYEL